MDDFFAAEDLNHYLWSRFLMASPGALLVRVCRTFRDRAAARLRLQRVMASNLPCTRLGPDVASVRYGGETYVRGAHGQYFCGTRSLLWMDEPVRRLVVMCKRPARSRGTVVRTHEVSHTGGLLFSCRTQPGPD